MLRLYIPEQNDAFLKSRLWYVCDGICLCDLQLRTVVVLTWVRVRVKNIQVIHIHPCALTVSHSYSEEYRHRFNTPVVQSVLLCSFSDQDGCFLSFFFFFSP